MNRKSIAAVAIVALSGCASSGRIGDLPPVPTGAASSQLILIRVSSLIGAPNSYYVSLDGKDVFTLRSGEYTEFPVPAGDHTIAVKCFGGFSPTWKEDSKGFNAMAGQPSYFEISPSGGCAEIQPIDPAKGQSEKAQTSFISPDKMSDKQ